MKNLLFIFTLLLSIQCLGQHEQHQTVTDTTKAKPKSPRKVAMAMVGDNHVHIDYGSPSVRGRQIWNGLVAYGQVWAAGAHKATWIDFSEDVKIDSKVITKGKYGLFIIPDKKTWTLILSKDWNMHLADYYKAENDMIRLSVKPKKSKKLVESLTYEVKEQKNAKGQLVFSWEYIYANFNFENVNK